jgi:hypothetical protein
VAGVAEQRLVVVVSRPSVSGVRWMQWMEMVRSTDGILEGEQGNMPDQKMQGKALQQSRWRKFKGRE